MCAIGAKNGNERKVSRRNGIGDVDVQCYCYYLVNWGGGGGEKRSLGGVCGRALRTARAAGGGGSWTWSGLAWPGLVLQQRNAAQRRKRKKSTPYL